MKIKIGGKYVTRCGSIVVCTCFPSDNNDIFFCRDDKDDFLSYSKYTLASRDSNIDFDIVALYKKPKNKSIKVKVGGKYLTRNGEVVECYKIDWSKRYPYRIGGGWYDEQLRLPLDGGAFSDNYEIVAEQHKEPKKTKLTEQQLQAIADAKIKIENTLIQDAKLRCNPTFIEQKLIKALLVAKEALELLTTQQ